MPRPTRGRKKAGQSMDILVFGGTRFFGISMVNELLRRGHQVTIATRRMTADPYGENVQRIVLDHTDAQSMKRALQGRHYDVAIDKIAYCSNDVRRALDALDCRRYILMSSTAVYTPKHMDTRESEFDPAVPELVWSDRSDFSYEEGKRQAECALRQSYSDRNWTAVRYPFVIGKDDYTKRLLFYVEHTMGAIPMNIDNINAPMGYIRSDEAGRFLAFLAEKNVTGAVNGSAEGTVSLREIIAYIERKTGTKAVVSPLGDTAPYNGEPAYSINTDRAKKLGFRFSALSDQIYGLLDEYIDLVARK